MKTQDLDKLAKATFAGGCFWCMESPFEKVPGVREVLSGYAGGKEENPTYKQVSSGKTGHVEAIQVYYDPDQVSYRTLVDIYWKQIDPTDSGGQFADRGSQYTTAIFYHNDEQKEIAEKSKKELEASGLFDNEIATQIKPYTSFFPAEDYHQNYYKKCPIRYKLYRSGSGRDSFLKNTWGEESKKTSGFEPDQFYKPTPDKLKQKLTRLQYRVTQENGTERAFANQYWNNKEEGIYVDVVSGEPLFSSTDKFDSGSGWPSFTQPLAQENIVLRDDSSHGMSRTEVRSKYADSHLGHVFNDGPAPTGKRYCINSASLRFISKEDLEKEGYEQYAQQFKKSEAAVR